MSPSASSTVVPLVFTGSWQNQGALGTALLRYFQTNVRSEADLRAVMLQVRLFDMQKLAWIDWDRVAGATFDAKYTEVISRAASMRQIEMICRALSSEGGPTTSTAPVEDFEAKLRAMASSGELGSSMDSSESGVFTTLDLGSSMDCQINAIVLDRLNLASCMDASGTVYLGPSAKLDRGSSMDCKIRIVKGKTSEELFMLAQSL